MPAALLKAQVDVFLHVIDALGRELPDGFRQQRGIIRDLHLLHILPAHMQHGVVVLGQLPLKGGL